MAGSADTSFNALLHADSDCNLPDSDAEVVAALSAYGVTFKKGKSEKAVEERLSLLSGLLWLHVHANDMSAAISAASDDQQRRLAAALRLDFAKDGNSALWPTLLSRKILANAVPGQTPKKLKAPDSRLDGQIKKPGAAPPPPDGGASKRPRRDPAGQGARVPAAASDASKSDSVGGFGRPHCRRPTSLWSCLTTTLWPRPPSCPPSWVPAPLRRSRANGVRAELGGSQLF
jgi:hypothetical protein